MQNQTKPKPLGASMAKLVLVVAIIVSLGAVAGYLAMNKPVKVSQQQISPATEPAKSVEDETADWKTYRNEEYGYEVKYPKIASLDYTDSEKTQPLFDVFFIVVETTTYSNINDWFENWRQEVEHPIDYEGVERKPKVISVEDILIQGNPAKKIWIKELPLTDTIVAIIKNNYLYKIVYTGSYKTSDLYTSDLEGATEVDPETKSRELVGEYRSIFNQMLSTFKFLDWQLFSIEEYGFSMKIHPDYKKTREEELERERLKMKIIVFSKDSEKIGITIDREPDTIKMMRAVLLDILNLGPEEWQKSLEYYSNLGLVESGAEFISKENVEIGACVGIHLLEKKEQKYKRNLILTSHNLENMYVTILFEYSTKDTESEILKMIETIECAK